jgi:hypothetical protein
MTADEVFEGAIVTLYNEYPTSVLCLGILNGEVNKDGMIMLAWQGPYGRKGRWFKSNGGGWYADKRTQLHPEADRILAEFTAWRLLSGDNNA